MQGGYTALILAAANGHVNAVQCFVEAEVNLKAADNVSVHVVWEHADG